MYIKSKTQRESNHAGPRSDAPRLCLCPRGAGRIERSTRATRTSAVWSGRSYPSALGVRRDGGGVRPPPQLGLAGGHRRPGDAVGGSWVGPGALRGWRAAAFCQSAASHSSAFGHAAVASRRAGASAGAFAPECDVALCPLSAWDGNRGVGRGLNPPSCAAGAGRKSPAGLRRRRRCR